MYVISSFFSCHFSQLQIYVTKNICVAEVMYDESDENHTNLQLKIRNNWKHYI